MRANAPPALGTGCAERRPSLLYGSSQAPPGKVQPITFRTGNILGLPDLQRGNVCPRILVRRNLPSPFKFTFSCLWPWEQVTSESLLTHSCFKSLGNPQPTSFIHSDCWLPPSGSEKAPDLGAAFRPDRFVYGPTRLSMIHVFGENGDVHEEETLLFDPGRRAYIISSKACERLHFTHEIGWNCPGLHRT